MNAATQSYIYEHREDPAADIAAFLAYDRTTVQPLDRKALGAYLILSRCYRKLNAARTSKDTHPDIREGLEDLEEAFVKQLDYIGTHEPEVAEQMVALFDYLIYTGVLTPEERDAIIDLAGGFRYDTLTEGEVQEELDRLESQGRVTELQAAYVTASAAVHALLYGDGPEPSAEDLVAAFSAALGLG